MASPAWLAEIEHSPIMTGVTLPSATVQMAGVFDVNTMGRSDGVVAVSATGTEGRVCVPGDVKVMIWVLYGLGSAGPSPPPQALNSVAQASPTAVS
jgi:hypothetical protein